MEKILGGWGNVPPNLKCKTDLKKLGLKPAAGAKFEVWNSYNWVPLYDISKTTPILPPTAEEKAAQKLARQEKKERTCKSCRGVVKDKIYINDNLCPKCQKEKRLTEWIASARDKALANFQRWHNNKDYLILDTETTGLNRNAEIIEIAICNLYGVVIFETFVKPLRSIPEDVIEIHGITNEMVSESPAWPEVWGRISPILFNKTILIYNASFDINIIKNDCKRHKLPIPQIVAECIMQNYAAYHEKYSYYHEDFTWISLKDAAEDWDIPHQAHRAAGDCIASSELIKRIAENHKKVENYQNLV